MKTVLAVPRLAMVVIFATVAWAATPTVTRAQSFQYPPYGAWRGHMVSRDGLFHVTKYHWGNGLTPTGGAFLTDAVHTIVPIIPQVLSAVAGRELDEQSRDGSRARSLARLDTYEDYAREQKRANDLLERTAGLVGLPGQSVASPPGGMRLQEELKKYPEDPWKANKE